MSSRKLRRLTVTPEDLEEELTQILSGSENADGSPDAASDFTFQNSVDGAINDTASLNTKKESRPSAAHVCVCGWAAESCKPRNQFARMPVILVWGASSIWLSFFDQSRILYPTALSTVSAWAHH